MKRASYLAFNQQSKIIWIVLHLYLEYCRNNVVDPGVSEQDLVEGQFYTNQLNSFEKVESKLKIWENRLKIKFIREDLKSELGKLQIVQDFVFIDTKSPPYLVRHPSHFSVNASGIYT